MTYHEKKKRYNPIYFLLSMALLAVFIFVGVEAYRLYIFDKEESDGIVYEKPPASTTTVPSASPAAVQKVETQLPEKALTKVPFTVQAPNANWDEVHEETCEEASLIMVKHFIRNTKFGTKDEADKEILDLVGFEEKNGYKVDVTTEELSKIAKAFYGLGTGRVENNASIEKIKREIASGRPVIVPAAGKLLPNPNFRNGGPNYHMLVVTGYDKDGFITNDPGTRKGEGFRYSFDALFNALHDWNANNMIDGAKNYLVFD